MENNVALARLKTVLEALKKTVNLSPTAKVAASPSSRQPRLVVTRARKSVLGIAAGAAVAMSSTAMALAVDANNCRALRAAGPGVDETLTVLLLMC
jgi:hypothetical protein